MHPRNRHQGRYDLVKLGEVQSELKRRLIRNPAGELTIDFADPVAVKTLNQALLKLYYGIEFWEVPEGYLSPPIPGRADYIHGVADVLSDLNEGRIPSGDQIKGIDIGVGANGIYPLIGRGEYGWSFLGTDIDPVALESVKLTSERNKLLPGSIQVRHQKNPEKIYEGILKLDEFYDFSLSNPPFYPSAEASRESSERKWRGLGKKVESGKPLLNFSGHDGELWCEGGEVEFIRKMIKESVSFKKNILLFTSLVSRESNLEALYRALEKVCPEVVETIEMGQGQKKSRFIAWTYHTEREREEWKRLRWK